MAFEYIRSETTEAGVLVLTLDDRTTRNALGGQLSEELAGEVDRCGQDPALRVLVLTAARGVEPPSTVWTDAVGAGRAGSGDEPAQRVGSRRRCATSSRLGCLVHGAIDGGDQAALSNQAVHGLHGGIQHRVGIKKWHYPAHQAVCRSGPLSQA